MQWQVEARQRIELAQPRLLEGVFMCAVRSGSGSVAALGVPIAVLLAAFVVAPVASAQGAGATGEEPIRVLLLGDSITQGLVSGDQTALSFAEVLERSLSITHEVTNIGCGGASTTDWTISNGATICTEWLEETIFENLAIPNLPSDFMTILLGTNDAVGFFEPAPVSPWRYRQNLDEIVAHSLMHGARTILLMTPPPPCETSGDRFDRLMQYRLEVFDLCIHDADVLCGPDLFMLLDPQLDFDDCSVHPNGQGHAKIALELENDIAARAPVSPGIEVFHWFVPSGQPQTGAIFPVAVLTTTASTR